MLRFTPFFMTLIGAAPTAFAQNEKLYGINTESAWPKGQQQLTSNCLWNVIRNKCFLQPWRFGSLFVTLAKVTNISGYICRQAFLF